MVFDSLIGCKFVFNVEKLVESLQTHFVVLLVLLQELVCQPIVSFLLNHNFLLHALHRCDSLFDLSELSCKFVFQSCF